MATGGGNDCGNCCCTAAGVSAALPAGAGGSLSAVRRRPTASDTDTTNVNVPPISSVIGPTRDAGLRRGCSSTTSLMG
jgi:hypothetical protein